MPWVQPRMFAEAIRPAQAALAALGGPEWPLSPRDRELIATVVSAVNRCFACLQHHGDRLRALDAKDDLIAALRADYRQADLPPRERAMLDYAWRLTVAPGAVQANDVDRLRSEGFDECAIAQI